MHRLRAVVKSFKADPVCQALIKAGVDEVYVEEVQGYGRQKGHLGLYRQPAYGIAFLPKIAITAYVTDGLLDAACKAIEETALTGTIGDGKIFITPIDYAIPHTLETGTPLAVAVRSPKPAKTVNPAKRAKSAKAIQTSKPKSAGRSKPAAKPRAAARIKPAAKGAAAKQRKGSGGRKSRRR